MHTRRQCIARTGSHALKIRPNAHRTGSHRKSGHWAFLLRELQHRYADECERLSVRDLHSLFGQKMDLGRSVLRFH